MRKKLSFFLLSALLLFAACSDDEPDKDDASPEVSSFIWSTACDTYDLEVEASGDWQILTDAEWLYISDDQLTGTGSRTVQVYVEQNPNEERRSATLTLVSDGKTVKVWQITQSGTAESDENALFTSDLSKTYAVGFGYDAFGEYATESYVKGQVINYQKLKAYEEQWNEYVANDDPQYDLNYAKAVAYSMSEFSETITRETNAKTNILFYKKEVNKRTTTTTTTKNEYSFATLSVLNVVAQRNISESAVKRILNSDDGILTDNFRTDVHNVRIGTLTADNFIKKYGTDVVLSAWLGGRLDYTTTIKKTTTTQIEKVVTTTYQKKFKKSSTMTQEEENFLQSIDVDYDCTCNVRGGSTAKLNKEIQKMIASKEPIDDAVFVEWESSFHDAESMLKSGLAALIDTRTIPVYELIRDSYVSGKIEDRINELAKADKFSADDPEDICYTVTIPDDLDEMQLVVDQSDGKTVVAELCKEFVPAIRTDRRVVVAYPILPNGLPNHERGFFVGDGDGNAPGWVLWDDNVASYYKESTYATTDVLTSLYVYNYDIAYKQHSYMPTKKATRQISEGTRLGSPLKVSKTGMYYWGYNQEGGYTYSAGATNVPSLSGYRAPDEADLNRLHSSLLGDFSLLFATDGRGGMNLPDEKAVFLLKNGSAAYVYASGYWQVAQPENGSPMDLILVRDNAFTYNQ